MEMVPESCATICISGPVPLDLDRAPSVHILLKFLLVTFILARQGFVECVHCVLVCGSDVRAASPMHGRTTCVLTSTGRFLESIIIVRLSCR